ncbi:lactonase family protein [Danxiaibacter flavus]|uniref:Lactonase family protein n=1 Tax=Danxiaibacter flavus TaxID=3049108 RepID=A0ABV3ZA71_9BACT|nr:lactonase family protein [Chitinophagaceae bacterium DXS]
MKKYMLLCFLLAASFVQAQNPIFYLLIGTYTKNQKDGIYVYRFNPNKTEATFVSKTSGVENPSYLAISKDQKFVYAVNENGDDKGAVSSFALDKKKGELTFLNKQSSGGDAPCYVTVDSTGKNVIAANYSGGNFSVFKTNADGSLQPSTQVIAHEGYGVNVKRQEQPHVHSVVLSPDQKFLFVADLGNDRLYRYSFDASDAKEPVKPLDPAYYELPDNSGPRHLAFHPNGKFAYLMTELSGKVVVYQYDNGNLTEIQTVNSDNSGSKDDKGGADVHVTPNGKFAYSSNRVTANDITVYRVGSDGKLTEAEHKKTGMHPRNFMIDPTGRFLLVANKDSNNIQIFVINKNYGLLEDTGVTINVDQPVCLKMVPVN